MQRRIHISLNTIYHRNNQTYLYWALVPANIMALNITQLIIAQTWNQADARTPYNKKSREVATRNCKTGVNIPFNKSYFNCIFSHSVKTPLAIYKISEKIRKYSNLYYKLVRISKSFACKLTIFIIKLY